MATSSSIGRTVRLGKAVAACGVLLACSGGLVGAGEVRGDTGCGGIQGAINALPPDGGVVRVASGTYNCTAPIVIDRDNVAIRGEGTSTVLRLADNVNAPVVVIGQPVPVPTITRQNIVVSDLVIDGNRANQTQECWGGPCETFPLRNNGISVRRVEGATIERLGIRSTRSGGLVTELGSKHLLVRDITSDDNQFDGIAGYETTLSTFSNITARDNISGAGMSFDIRFRNNLVTDSTLVNNNLGIFMRDSTNNTFNGLVIHRSHDHGIFLAQVDNDAATPAARNTFTAMTVSESGGSGLRANDASVVDNAVTAAQFTANAGGCVSEAVPGQVHQSSVICR